MKLRDGLSVQKAGGTAIFLDPLEGTEIQGFYVVFLFTYIRTLILYAKARKRISESQEKFIGKPLDKALEMWDTTSTENERTKQTETTFEGGNHRKVIKTISHPQGLP